MGVYFPPLYIKVLFPDASFTSIQCISLVTHNSVSFVLVVFFFFLFFFLNNESLQHVFSGM